MIGTTYRPPNSKINPFKKYFKNLLEKNNRENKVMYLVGDFNLNVLNYDVDTKVRNFFDMMFKFGMISLINKPTSVTKHSISAIDHIFMNTFYNTNLKTGIIKSDLSDHFPIYLADNKIDISSYPQNKIFFKRIINDNRINAFKTELQKLDWKLVMESQDPNESYNIFLCLFSKLYDEIFPTTEVKIKTKSLLSPWMTRGLIKSSKQKQKLYEKTWQVIKEVTGKTKLRQSTFPQMMIINNIESYDKDYIASSFNKYFTDIGPNLASTIDKSTNTFESYLTYFHTFMEQDALSIEEYKTAFEPLKSNKACGYGEISSNVVKHIYEEIKSPMLHIFSNSIKNGVFPETLKITKVIPLFKSRDEARLNNYRPTSILPIFSKILENCIQQIIFPSYPKQTFI